MCVCIKTLRGAGLGPQLAGRIFVVVAGRCGLRAAGCGLRAAGCGLRAAGCGLRAAGCGLRAAGWICISCGAVRAAGQTSAVRARL